MIHDLQREHRRLVERLKQALPGGAVGLDHEAPLAGVARRDARSLDQQRDGAKARAHPVLIGAIDRIDVAPQPPRAPLGVLRDGVAELPGSASLRATLAGRLEATGAYEEAAQEYTALVRLRPLDPDVRYREAFSLVRSGDHEQARASLRDALELQHDHPEALLLLGSLEQTVDPDEGRRLLTRFLEGAPEHPQADRVRDWLAEREEEAG